MFPFESLNHPKNCSHRGNPEMRQELTLAILSVLTRLQVCRERKGFGKYE